MRLIKSVFIFVVTFPAVTVTVKQPGSKILLLGLNTPFQLTWIWYYYEGVLYTKLLIEIT